MGFKVAIVGATGAVGAEFIAVLERRRFPIDEIVLLASKRSAGSVRSFAGRDVTVTELTHDSFAGCHLALFSAGARISREYARSCVDAGCIMIDNSSAFRMDPTVPLIVPEVNPDAIKGHQGIIANPNCTTIIALVALNPLHRAVPIRRVVAATYQAASGAGYAAMEELREGTRAALEDRSFTPKILPFPYAFNLFPHNSPMTDNGYCEEELKLARESIKIMGDPSIHIHGTCIRVPVLRTHGEALNVEFTADLSVDRAYALLRQAPGVRILEDRSRNRWAMPIDVAGQDDVHVGRIRKDPTQPNTLDLWVVGDQLLKGAALNAVQLAELALTGRLWTAPAAASASTHAPAPAASPART